MPGSLLKSSRSRSIISRALFSVSKTAENLLTQCKVEAFEYLRGLIFGDADYFTEKVPDSPSTLA
jgi:hypothetical protein